MPDTWTQRWNDRFSGADFAYGEEPNAFLKDQLALLAPGRILFPAEGEGRNAVYAATQGWTVSAFDISDAGQRKAALLAEKRGVTIDYRIGELPALDYPPASFDAIALIYAHFPAALKSVIHRQLVPLLRPGGTLIFEAFSKSHLAYRERNEKVGGPAELDMLFSEEELRADFPEFEVALLREEVIELHEGAYHDGVGAVIRFVGRKG